MMSVICACGSTHVYSESVRAEGPPARIVHGMTITYVYPTARVQRVNYALHNAHAL